MAWKGCCKGLLGFCCCERRWSLGAVVEVVFGGGAGVARWWFNGGLVVVQDMREREKIGRAHV